MRRTAWPSRLALGAALIGAASCGDVIGPLSGAVSVRLEGPAPVRSAAFRLVGPQSAVSAGAGTSNAVFTAAVLPDTLLVAVVAPVGHTLAEGPLIRVQVPDVRRVAGYRVSLLQVASADYTLQDEAKYTLTIGP